MKHYEVVLMFYPNVEEEKRTAAFDRLKAILEQEGKVTKIDEWGLKRLAYEIEYLNEAYYTVVEFEANPETVKEFDRVAKILDPVMRHMIVNLDK